MSEFPYLANATLDDGSEVVVDLEEHGWADKVMLAHTVRWSLVPKENYLTMTGGLWPLVSINIPTGAKPVYRSRVYAGFGVGITVPAFRVFCIGWKLGSTTVWTWILPTGSIEVGTDDDSHLADVLRTHLNKQLTPHG